MDFKWSYDQEEPSFFIPHPHEPPSNSYSAVKHSADAHPIGPIMDLCADYVRCYLGNESNGEIDIETITPTSEFNMEIISGVESNQNILTYDLIHSGMKQVDEEILRMKEADSQPVSGQHTPMDVASLSAAQGSQDWHYVQLIDNFGGTQCFAVNEEAQELKQQVEQMIKQHPSLSPEQPDCSSKLYRLLNYLPSESTSIDPQEFQPVTEFMPQVDSNSGKSDTQSNCRSGNISIPDSAIVTLPVEKMIEEICSLDAVEAIQETKEEKDEFVITIHSESIKNAVCKFRSIPVPTPSITIQPTEEFSCDVAGFSPSIPESAMQPVTNYTEIGPFCTAAGIFSNVFDLTDLPTSQEKLKAEKLKNGVVIELHSHFSQVKETRRNFARALSLFFDVKLDWTNQRVVSRLFSKAMNPLLAKRADLARCHVAPTSRRASHSRKMVKQENGPHEQISQFDAAVFVIPPDGFEDPNPNLQVIKTSDKKVKKDLDEGKLPASKVCKPTQGQQLLQLQTRFDAFRRAQRKHNAAFLRHIHLIQRQLQDVKWKTSKHILQNRRRSMPSSMYV
jgi:hypothetical protein